MPQRLRNGPYSWASEPHPDGSAVEIDADQVAGAEQGEDMLAVGGRRRHRHAAGRELPFRDRRTEEASVPQLPAVVAVEAEQVQAIVKRPSEAVMKTRSPQTIGALTPAPGSFAFQRTFSVADQCVGSTFSVETPLCCGPRQPGQSSAETRSGAAAG